MKRRAIYYESDNSKELLHKLSDSAVTKSKLCYFGLAYISIDALLNPLIKCHYAVGGLSPVRKFKLSDKVYHLVFPFYKISENGSQYDEIICYVCIRNYKFGEHCIFFDILDRNWNYLAGKDLCFSTWARDAQNFVEEVVFENLAGTLRSLFETNFLYGYHILFNGKYEYIRVRCHKYNPKTNYVEPTTFSLVIL